MNEISAQPRIVYIDDDRNQLALVERFLSGPFEVITAESGEDGLRIISETPPDLVLLDINMPKMDGYEVCTRLQAIPKTSFIPVVFLTAMEEEKDRPVRLRQAPLIFWSNPSKRMRCSRKCARNWPRVLHGKTFRQTTGNGIKK